MCLHCTVQAVPLNRYIVDYWKHGQKAALVAANGLREGDAWQVRGAALVPLSSPSLLLLLLAKTSWA